MQTYISPDVKNLLEANQLHDFEHFWNYRGEWFESPNHGRGGWSGVNRLALKSPQGNELGLFLKRQQNYIRRTFLHPFSGVSTFSCEFETLRHLFESGVGVPKLVFFSEKPSNDGMQAILVTEELHGYRALDDVAREVLFDPARTRAQKNALIKSAALTVRKLHDAGVQHRAMHPKHLMVNMDDPDAPRSVVIDFEKARPKFFAIRRALRDLSTLNRDLPFVGSKTRLCFLKHYLGVSRLSFSQKILCRLILRRSRKRMRKSAQEALA